MVLYPTCAWGTAPPLAHSFTTIEIGYACCESEWCTADILHYCHSAVRLAAHLDLADLALLAWGRPLQQVVHPEQQCKEKAIKPKQASVVKRALWHSLLRVKTLLLGRTCKSRTQNKDKSVACALSIHMDAQPWRLGISVDFATDSAAGSC